MRVRLRVRFRLKVRIRVRVCLRVKKIRIKELTSLDISKVNTVWTWGDKRSPVDK